MLQKHLLCQEIWEDFFRGDHADLERFSNREEKKPPNEWQKCAITVGLSSLLLIDF